MPRARLPSAARRLTTACTGRGTAADGIAACYTFACGTTPVMRGPLGDMNDETNPVLDLFEHFDKLQLEVLAVHAAVQRRLLAVVATRLNCSVEDLPNLKFMHAATLAYAGRHVGDTIALLQKLDSVRNEVAHENDSFKFLMKFASLARAVLGPNYMDNPPDVAAVRRQAYSTLHFVKTMVESPSAN